MRKLPIIYVILVTAFIAACASAVLERKTVKGYTVGRELTTPIGVPFLVDQDGTIETVKTWVGLLNSPNGWKIE